MRTGTSGISPVAGGAGRSRVSCVGAAIVHAGSGAFSASNALSPSTAGSAAEEISDTGEAIRNNPRQQPHLRHYRRENRPKSSVLRLVPEWDHLHIDVRIALQSASKERFCDGAPPVRTPTIR